MENKNTNQTNQSKSSHNEYINRYYVSPELAREEWAGLTVANVHGFMLNRYNFFLSEASAKTEDVYFESQKAIAETLGLSEKTVNRAIQSLEKNGYLKYKLIHKGASFKNSYVIYDINKIVPVKTVSKPDVKVKPKHRFYDDEDEPNLPF